MESSETEPTDEELQKEWPYLSRQQLEDLREAFEMFDKRKAGAFTAEDLQKVLSDLGENISAKDVDNIVAGLDTDGDGVIDFAQFVLVMMHNVRKAQPEKDLQGVFSVFDKSGDGFISQEDLRAAIKSMGGQELSEDDISIALGMVDHKDGLVDYNEFLRLVMSPDNPKPASRTLQASESGDLTDERRIDNRDSFKASFKDLTITEPFYETKGDYGERPLLAAIHGVGSSNGSRLMPEARRELRASTSGQEAASSGAIPELPDKPVDRMLIHNKSSKKRPALASDQQRMASLWSR